MKKQSGGCSEGKHGSYLKYQRQCLLGIAVNADSCLKSLFIHAFISNVVVQKAVAQVGIHSTSFSTVWPALENLSHWT